jgi:hypothetical protein
MKRKQTYYIALGGLIAALSVILMALTFIPSSTIILPAIAGVLLISVVLEAGTKWALLIFVAVSLLSLVLAPDVEAKVFYIMFFGYYPIIKKFLEGKKSKWIQWLLKLIILNVCSIIIYYIIIKISGIPKEFNQQWYLALSWILINITFIIYDFALTRLITLYILKIRKIFKFKF